MTDYTAVLAAIRPGAEWSLNNNDYATLEWYSDSPKPSKKTLDDAWPAVERDLEIARVRAERHALYQAETDGLYFEAMRGEGTVDLDAWKAAVQAIKDAHPWPA